MEHTNCHNTCNNMSYRQRSQTLQPERDSKGFMLDKYFKSLEGSYFDTEQRASYANVPLDMEQAMFMHQPEHLHPLPHQHAHNRSHSQHYYNTMSHNYYNLSIPIRPPCSRRHSPVNEPTRVHNVEFMDQLDSITMIQVCNELGYVDSPPPLPASRNYTISRWGDDGYHKFSFPQRRRVKTPFTDPSTGFSLKPGNWVTVHGISKTDRSKFFVSYKNLHHFDLPLQFTIPPQPSWN